jgi:amidase
MPVDADVRVPIERFVLELERAGCRVEALVPAGFDLEAAWENWSLLFTIEVGASMPPGMIEAYAADPKIASDPFIRRGVERAASNTMAEFAAALAARDKLICALEAFLTEWDVLLCPVTPTPAIAHCAPGTPIRVGDRTLPYWTGCSGFTNPFNLTGHPVAVLPIALSARGLPIGVQLIGKRWSEADLLAVAAEIALLAPRMGPPPAY